MAIAHRSGTYATAQADNVQVAQAMQSGAMLVCFAYWSSGGVTLDDITDTDGGTWVVVNGPNTGDGGEAGCIAARYNVGATQPTVTVNFTGSPAYTRIRLAEFTGAAASAAADQDNTAQTTDADSPYVFTTGAVTPTEDGELIVAAFFEGSGGSWTPMASPAFTELGDVGSNCWEYYVQPTAAAITPEATTDTGSNCRGMVVTFKEAAVSVTVVPIILQNME